MGNTCCAYWSDDGEENVSFLVIGKVSRNKSRSRNDLYSLPSKVLWSKLTDGRDAPDLEEMDVFVSVSLFTMADAGACRR